MDSNRGAQDLRIVLVGITGAGKSASANTILGRKAFESKLSAASLTVQCEKVSTQFEGQTLYVVDTPGLHDTNLPQEQAMSEIARCISFAAPGPHVFLVVIKPTKFTKEQKETVRIIQDLFGEEAERYTMVLFTCGDNLEVDEITIEQFFESNKALNDFVQQCKGGYHVFNNRNKDCSQVRELLKKINRMVWRNGGRYYTNKMLEEAERAIEAKKERLQRENESLTAKEARALAEKFNEFIQVVKMFYEAGRADRAAADRAAAEDAARRAAADRAAAVDAARRAAADRAAAEAAAHRAAAGAAAHRGAAGAHFGATVGSAVGGLVDSATKNCIIQ